MLGYDGRSKSVHAGSTPVTVCYWVTTHTPAGRAAVRKDLFGPVADKTCGFEMFVQ